MRHFTMGSVCLLCGWMLTLTANPARAADGPVVIQPGQPQLFVDDFLIESQVGLKRTLRQPVKENGGRRPVIASRPGETLLAYGTIVYDPKNNREVIFAKTSPPFQMSRLTSKDGLDRGPPESWYAEPIAIELTAPASGRKATNTDYFSCYYDTKDDQWPYKGWMWYANWGDDLEGIHFMRSRDGKTWERGPMVVDGWAGGDDLTHREIRQDGRTLRGPGDVTLFSYDPVEDRFLGLFKFFTPYAIDPRNPEVPLPPPVKGKKRTIPVNELRSRAYVFFDKLDAPFDTKRIERIALLPAAREANGDMPYDEYYQSTAWRYGPMWLGSLKIWHSHGDYPWSEAGCAFLKLVSSRDGLNWKKVPFANDDGIPEVFIPNGPQDGNNGQNDGGYISDFSQGPLRIGDELIYYYSASSHGKNGPADVRIRGGGIFRARLRLDGFVSVDAGELTTRPLEIQGGELLVNGIGPIEVAVVGDSGRVIASARLTGDSLRHAVKFDGRSLREVLDEAPPRLRFSVRDGGRLYSFSVQ